MKLIITIFAFTLLFITLNVNAHITPTVQPNDSLEIEILKILNETKWEAYHFLVDGKFFPQSTLIGMVKIENRRLILNFKKLGFQSVNLIKSVVTISDPKESVFQNKITISDDDKTVMFFHPKKGVLGRNVIVKLQNLLVEYNYLVFASKIEEFRTQHKKYFELQEKPTVTEEQRKFIVQANAQNEEKKYANALKLYEKAIEVNSFSYPSAYYNMALISAQLTDYNYAIFNMKKYLLIEPNAPDARVAQDKIYEWELSIGK